MPRKTQDQRVVRRPGRSGFNEAAARCRGKPAAAGAPPRPLERASMRPRPDAAENHPAEQITFESTLTLQ